MDTLAIRLINSANLSETRNYTLIMLQGVFVAEKFHPLFGDSGAIDW